MTARRVRQQSMASVIADQFSTQVSSSCTDSSQGGSQRPDICHRLVTPGFTSIRRDGVASRRASRVELGQATRKVSIPQIHEAGAEAEFGEFYATIAGPVVKSWMFEMRLSHSGRAFHVAFATQAQEAFLGDHLLAFDEYFRGVPGRRIRLVLLPPGIDGVHEKGGVGGEIGRFRRPRAPHCRVLVE